MKKLILTLGAVGLLALLSVSGCGRAGLDAGAPPRPRVSSDLKAYAAKCERSAGEWRTARIDYPTRMSAAMREELTFKAVVDIRREPAPPASVIPYADEAASDTVTVRCTLAARLVAVSDTIDVRDQSGEDGGWRYQNWSPSGVVEWTWTIEPQAPGTQRLRLELTPAVVGTPDQFSSLNRVSYESTLAVHASALARVWYWFQTDWGYLKAIAAALGTAALGILTVSKKGRDLLKNLIGKEQTMAASTK